MIAWDSLCIPKGMGGLGFRDLRLFNIVLLGRQVWRLINNKDTLCYCVLCSKYFSDGDVLPLRRILHVVKALKTRFGWQIGDGMTARFKVDIWGFEGDGNSLKTSFNGIRGGLVSELWRLNSCVWNRDRVEELYGDRLSDHLCILPIVQHGPPDQIVWFHNKFRSYSSKSGYSWLILKKMGYSPHRLFWRTIWKLHVLSKIRIFAWKVNHNLLPTNVKMALIFQGSDWVCHRCGLEDETIIHALRDCPKARVVLSFSELDGRLLDFSYESCIDLLEDATRLLDLKDDARLIWEWVRTLGDNFRIFNLSHAPMNLNSPRPHRWIKPPNDAFKINIDVVVFDSVVGIRIIARDHDGFVFGDRAVFLNYKMDVEWAEVEALREGII
ncbi:hypothetical protein V6Z11_D13G062700 [Gossypium hirsutum]